MARYLGLDASTQSLTGLVIDSDRGEIVAETSIRFDERYAAKYGISSGVIDNGNGVIHSDPRMWLEALDLLLKTLQQRGHDLSAISAVSGSSQQHGTVYLNENAGAALARLTADASLCEQLSDIFSRPTSPVWMDSSTTRQCREIEQAVGGRDVLLDLTGNPAFERFSAPQIRKFYQDAPNAYAQTTDICLVSSFMASALAGRIVPVDPGDGSGTGLMNIRTRQWSNRALAATAPSLAERLAPVTLSDRAVGAIHPYFINRYNFSADCLVVPFSGDNPCSLIGLGIIDPGQVAISLGTSDTLFAGMEEPRPSISGEGCVFASPDDVHYMALICFMNGGLAREAVRDQFGLDWVAFNEHLRLSKPGNDGRLMLPYFDSEIVPETDAGVVRHQLDANDVRRNVRAVVEEQALSSRIHSKWMKVDFSSLYLTGGASANANIAQIFANVHGCPVRTGKTTNAAALGAAIKAYRGHRPDLSWPTITAPFCRTDQPLIEPDPSTRALYDEMTDAYADLESKRTKFSRIIG